jgi:glutathione peroxidase
MQKIDVNGKDAHPMFNYLKEQASTEEHKGLKAKAAAAMFNKISKSVEKDSDIKWNFTKFLIDREGNVVCRFEPTAQFAAITEALEKLL